MQKPMNVEGPSLEKIVNYRDAKRLEKKLISEI